LNLQIYFFFDKIHFYFFLQVFSGTDKNITAQVAAYLAKNPEVIKVTFWG
jgi:hypothetical protein